ncbi:MAG: tRNA (guanosine(37)-N1)-methyltransferase TrmD [Deltaproteobacteria bacterium]|nr:tRNA (guanosine(37)-N1)-methyltransferase TrmD [Deltaproteobacteria bacterium]TLN04771.1 MAG: tRNA (guanosine(37)-N1)-methyltransferase TrmD [bacterium]
MKFDLLTLFPGMFSGPFSESIIKNAVEKGLVEISLHNIRDFAFDKHRVTDDYPYGGGAGMVMKVEPLTACLESVKAARPLSKVILTTPGGHPLSQSLVEELAAEDGLIIICGRYEGVDERIRELFVDLEISIGDFILTGGEPAAVVLVDAVSRFIPGVLGSSESARDDSFGNGLLEYPQYTRPPVFRGLTVPPVLLSGNHLEIKRWRRRQSLSRTFIARPELLETAALTEEEKQYIRTLRNGGGIQD